MRSKEELAALKEEAEALSKKLAELSEEELKEVAGGADYTPARDIYFVGKSLSEEALSSVSGGSMDGTNPFTDSSKMDPGGYNNHEFEFESSPVIHTDAIILENIYS